MEAFSDLLLAWPLTQLLNPSSNSSLPNPASETPSQEVHIPALNRYLFPTLKSPLASLSGSGAQREIKSGLCFPTRFFIPLVTSIAAARASPKPSHAVLSCHSLVLSFPTRFWGTRKTERAMKSPGAIVERTARSQVGIFACS